MTRRFKGFGTASVSFGEPLELSTFIAGTSDDLTEAVAQELMKRINAVIPVLGVPLVARHILAEGTIGRADLVAAVTNSTATLAEQGLPRPLRQPAEVVADALLRLGARELISESGDQISVTAKGRDVLEYYATSIAHHFDASAEKSGKLPHSQSN